MKVELKNTNDTKTTYEYFHVLTEPHTYEDFYDGTVIIKAGTIIKVTKTPYKLEVYTNRDWGTINGENVKLVEKKKTVTTVIETKVF